MATIPICLRIDSDLDTDLVKEAKRRKQEKPDLIRTFIRDGLARYDAYSEQILQTQLAMLEQLKKLQEMIGAAVHLDVEQNVLALPQEPSETQDAYRERLKAAYRTMVFEALAKGARIAAAGSNKPVTAKTDHDR